MTAQSVRPSRAGFGSEHPAGGPVDALRIAAFSLAVWLVHLAILLPKPVHIDDLPYIESAKYILSHPLQPHCNTFNWVETPRVNYRENLNPPGWDYIEAAWILFVGPSVRGLRLLASLFVLFAAITSCLIARRFTQRPLLAAALFLLSPTLLPAVNNMMDLPATAFGLASVAAFLAWLDRKHAGLGVLSGMLAAAAVMTKYNMIVIVPILLVCGLERSRLRDAWPAVVPIAGLGLWALHNYFFYPNHEIHLFMLGRYRPFPKDWFGHALSLATVLGSSFIFLGAFRLICTPPHGWTLVTAVLLAGFWLCGPLLYRHGASATSPRVDYYVFAINSVFLLAFALVGFRRAHNVDRAQFLGAWFCLVILFQFACAYHVSPRYFFFAFLPFTILLVRAFDAIRPRWRQLEPLLVYGSVATQLLIGLALAMTDQAHAAASRDYPAQVRAKYGAQARIYHLGHWGLQYYCAEEGILSFDARQFDIRPGDLFIVADRNPNENSLPIFADSEFFRPKEPPRLFSNPGPWTLSNFGTAWFYAVTYPQVPYAWRVAGDVAERFQLLEAVRPASSAEGATLTTPSP